MGGKELTDAHDIVSQNLAASKPPRSALIGDDGMGIPEGGIHERHLGFAYAYLPMAFCTALAAQAAAQALRTLAVQSLALASGHDDAGGGWSRGNGDGSCQRRR